MSGSITKLESDTISFVSEQFANRHSPSMSPSLPRFSSSNCHFQEYFPSELSPAILDPIRRTIASLKSLGAIVVPVSLPSTSYALSAYYVLASAEASSNMARYDGVQYGTSLPFMSWYSAHFRPT